MHQAYMELFAQEIEDFCQAMGKEGKLLPGFSLSIKTNWRNLFGIEEEILLIGQSQWPEMQFPSPENWTCARLENLHGLLAQPDINVNTLSDALSNSRAMYDAPVPSEMALLHAALKSKFVIFCLPNEPLSVISFFSSQKESIAGMVENGMIIPFIPNFHHLCQEIFDNTQIADYYVLLKRGFLIGAEKQETVQATLEKLLQNESQKITKPVSKNPSQKLTSTELDFLTTLRSEVSAQRDRPMVLHLDDSPEMRQFSTSAECIQLTQTGIQMPGISAYTGTPVLLSDDNSAQLILPKESIASASVLVKPGLGVIVAADSIDEARQITEMFRVATKAFWEANQMGVVELLNEDSLAQAEQWIRVDLPTRKQFSGEVALITGAASGIGKAVAKAFLQRGGAIVGLDINTLVESTFDHPCYSGICCDVVDESKICETMHMIKHCYGGLDMLILNAGLFPSGRYIENLSLAEFTRVLNINFIANLGIMREAFPLLRKAPRYGRVVIVGSKNTRAPGPGAAAYSTSKAALTQLARVAALEWGCERIRVNVIHPDAVFDTGIYSDEVLQARAKNYGITVEQYKKRNLLKTEITSHDVAEMIAEMCGPLFRHMTGGQIQLDGGNDRTI
jgi:NAD(P)-dependent dehydrogenase (short-subunit alcohol dehydrogenase family)/rhamnose utilization protein RhaD (predicted bifunctional aldolase and dehydrogenase)